MRNRSVEMVEALYSMNRVHVFDGCRLISTQLYIYYSISIFDHLAVDSEVILVFKAYLSLPEGTASVVGLIAMMTDHYNVLVRLN